MWLLRRLRSKNREDPDKAIENAQKHLSRIEERGEEVNHVSNSLKEIRQQNHFAEAMEEIILRARETP
jgi:hypothetical protein